MRNHTLLDELIGQAQAALNTLFTEPKARRPQPGAISAAELTVEEKTKVIRLLRVDHAGEVCAQALYQGQALASRNAELQATLKTAAEEENDHLAWCAARLKALHGHASWLNPVWYAGAWSLGVVAGFLGERWNLGFLAETERQVTEHLNSHLRELPVSDNATRQLLSQMRDDEMMHAHTAEAAGGEPLPSMVRVAMRAAAKVMTTIAARL